jgi:hypothetical protein
MIPEKERNVEEMSVILVNPLVQGTVDSTFVEEIICKIEEMIKNIF